MKKAKLYLFRAIQIIVSYYLLIITAKGVIAFLHSQYGMALITTAAAIVTYRYFAAKAKKGWPASDRKRSDA